MILVRRIAVNLTLFLNVLLIFLTIFEDKVRVPLFLQVTGRLHPAVVHFPLALIFVAIFLEWIRARNKNQHPHTNESIDFILYFFAVSASVSALFGLFLFKEGAYSGNEIDLHRWTGTAVSLLAAGILVLKRLPNQRYYYAMLALTAICLTVAGHVGSEVTHGKGFVMEPIRRQQKRIEIEHPDSAIVFRDVIQPILNEKCVSCHNDNKAKNDLILTDYNDIMNGGEHRDAVVAGAAEESLLYKYVMLPMSDTLHMPPEGRLQLDREEIRLIGWWISTGAAENEQYLHMDKVDSIHPFMQARFQPKTGLDLLDIPFADPDRIKALNNPYRTVSQISAVKPYVAVFLGSKKDFSTNDLRELNGLSEQIVSIDLGNSEVSDADLKSLAGFPHLQKLHLQNLSITDNGLQSLRGLRYLEVLNLSGTNITNKALDEIAQWNNLTRLYIYNTSVDDASVQTLRNENPQLSVFKTQLDLSDSIYDAQLTLPVVKIDSLFFKDHANVEVKPSRGKVSFYYTLDGSIPTSASSLYSTPFTVDQTRTLKFIAMMEGWSDSNVATFQLMKTGLTPAAIQVMTTADPKMSAKSDSVLVDRNPGSFDRGDKAYLVFLEQDFDVIFETKEATTVSHVALSFLQDIRNGVLPPESVEVWGGMERGKLVSLAKGSPPPVESETAEKAIFTLVFQEQEVRFLRVRARNTGRLPASAPKKTKAMLCVDEVSLN